MSQPCRVCPPERARIPHRGLVCDSDRARLATQLSEIPDLVAELRIRETVLDEAPNRGGRDPVADETPAASIAARRGQRVTGTRERPAPISINALDLTDQARGGTVHDAFGDQVGELSAATILDLWVQELRIWRGRREGLPRPNVNALVHWLSGERLEDACDSFPAVGDMAAEIRRLRSVLRAQLGLVGTDDELKDGVVCPKCDSRAGLYQSNGSDRIECAVCGVLLTVDEFNRWTKLLAANITWLRGQVCPSCGAGRLYTFRGFPEVHCGWCKIHRV